MLQAMLIPNPTLEDKNGQYTAEQSEFDQNDAREDSERVLKFEPAEINVAHIDWILHRCSAIAGRIAVLHTPS